jgi:putative flippase GtrA
MLDIILDTLIDAVKMLPFLFVSYFIMEYIEHKNSDKIKKALASSGKFGNIVGAILGCFPQCGFSVTAASLYSGRVITLGTLISVFLATSDEAIPVMLSNPGSYPEMIKIILIKVVIGFVAGTLIDLVLRKNSKNKNVNIKEQADEHIHKMCSDCECDHDGILKSTINHTVNVFAFIVIVSFILNIAINFIGETNLSKILLSGSVLQPIVAGLIGLIPNCASSVLLTELYLSGSITFASVIAGLSTGAGIGLVVLFKTNKNIKENLKIVGLTYLMGTLAGIIIEIFGYIF